MKKLSIVIPAYNEERTLGALLDKIRQVPTEQKGFEKEVIVVDDGSTDQTSAIAQQRGVIALKQANQGKGAAVQKGIQSATGDYVLVQDADLEYDPQDYLKLLDAVLTGEKAVYGSRVLGQIARNGWLPLPGKHPAQGLGPWLANLLLSLWTFILYGRWITDPLTGYKLYPVSQLRKRQVKTHGFETDHEWTAHLIKNKVSIEEVPVAYTPRSVSEGKKIKLSDGFIAVWTLLKFRFVN